MFGFFHFPFFLFVIAAFLVRTSAYRELLDFLGFCPGRVKSYESFN